MLNTVENVALILVCIALSCGFLVILNRLWPPVRRRVHNDVIGWEVAVIGTIYAVMIGFMLYAVWGNYETADANVSDEANSAVNLFRLAGGLPQKQRESVRNLVQNYVNAMITEEWPEMNQGKESATAHQIIHQLWSTTVGTQTDTDSQRIILAAAISALTDVTRHRRLRRLENHSGLPVILWAVLICGGIITVASACLIGSENAALHLTLVIGLSLLIALTLAAIADIDGPFRGSVHISPYAFVQAQRSMADSNELAAPR
jgi:hypothetical protein